MSDPKVPMEPMCSECNDSGKPCAECCEHEFDMDEGGMCLNCGAEDWYNHFDEDYGQER